MSSDPALPWYQRARRWGQTNLNEMDPADYDTEWWRQYWRRTRVQGIIVNAGGIVAFYPTQVPLHHRAAQLGDRDLFGEILAAAREEGIAVVARMDSCRTYEEVYRAKPDWFTVSATGEPYNADGLYQACINRPYVNEHIPAVLREITTRYKPDGFTDNNWSVAGQSNICFCPDCRAAFKDHADLDLPQEANWSDPAYRRWIAWSYQRRVEIWDLFNRVTREAGGSDCHWIGMNHGPQEAQAGGFRDAKALCERAPMILIDFQGRAADEPFYANAVAGKLYHGLAGWNKLVPESTATYHVSIAPRFRHVAKPEPEVRLWAVEGFAGGIQPWWHHIGASQEDRRQFLIAEPIFRWHEQNEHYLIDREPVATVGVVWSMTNIDFFGRGNSREITSQPFRGIIDALVRARIPWIPVHADHVERDGPSLRVLVLPNLGAMTDGQCDAVRRFVQRGGGLIATGQSSRFDQWGEPRPDFALADLFGAHATDEHHGTSTGPSERLWYDASRHTYLRLPPSDVATDAPRSRATADEPRRPRHAVLKGFEQTDLLPFGGRIEVTRPAPGAQVVLTLVPEYPFAPPEYTWPRQTHTDIPGLILNESHGRRVAYLPTDLDRCFHRDRQIDHANLMTNLFRWAAWDAVPLRVEGPGLLDCHLYRQPGRLILHVVNLNNAGAWRSPVEELVPVGPIGVRVQAPPDLKPSRAELRVAGREVDVVHQDGWVNVELPSVLDHELIVIE